MLLNERAVLGLGSEEGRRWKPKMEGKLWTRGESGRWEARWAELRGNLLHLWVKRGIEGAGIAVVVVEDGMVELAEEEEGRETAFRLRFLSSNRTLAFAAENPAAMEAWVAALASASNAHARLILNALKETLPPPPKSQLPAPQAAAEESADAPKAESAPAAPTEAATE